MDEREGRVGLNEAVFRSANERIRDLNEAFATVVETYEVVCECGDSSCAARFRMSPDEYEALRARSDQFVIVPGHEAASVEEVVVDRGSYQVVRKHPGAPRRLAEATDES